MAVRGWVYVISNHAMPGLVKVGFTLKDPALRAQELSHTGMPCPYRVDHEVLLDEPRGVEQRAHRRLVEYSAGKEWFKCSAETAISAIRSSYDGSVHAEKFLRVDRQQVERAISVERLRAEENERLMQQDKKCAAYMQQQVREIRQRYEEAIDTSLEVTGVGWYWATASITISIAFAWLLPDMDGNLGMGLAAIFGTAAAFFFHGRAKESARRRPQYRQLVTNRDREVAQVEATAMREAEAARAASNERVAQAVQQAGQRRAAPVSTSFRSASTLHQRASTKAAPQQSPLLWYCTARGLGNKRTGKFIEQSRLRLVRQEQVDGYELPHPFSPSWLPLVSIENELSADGSRINSCPNCGLRQRFPAGKHLEARCVDCKITWIQHT